MKQHLSKFMILIMLFTIAIGWGPLATPSYAAGFQSTPEIMSISKGNGPLNVLKSRFTPDVNGTAYCLLLAENGTPINPATFDPAIMGGDVFPQGIYGYKALGVTSGNEVIADLDYNTMMVQTGQTYKLQVFIRDGVTNYEPSEAFPKFQGGAGIISNTLIKTYDNGFQLQYETDIPGKVYAKLYAPAEASGLNAENVTNPSHPYQLAGGEYFVSSSKSLTVTLRSSNNISSDHDYKALAVFQDNYGVLHTQINDSGVHHTSANRLLSVHYDNGVLSNPEDDKIVLTFENKVTAAGDSAEYSIEFDNNSPTFVNSDLSVSVNDFTTEAANNQVFLKLSPTAVAAIDTSGEFDNGSMKVSVMNGTSTLLPGVDIEYSQCTAILNQVIIQQADAQDSQLLNLAYDTGADLGDKSDDTLILTLSNANSSMSPGPTDSLLLDADNDMLGGFKDSDVTFIRDTDYHVTSIDGQTKRFTFTAEGVTKLNTLNNATFRVQLGNVNWGLVTMDPSVHSVFVNVKNADNRLLDLKVQGQTVSNFSSDVLEYSITTTHTICNQVDLISYTAAPGSTVQIYEFLNDWKTYKIQVTADNGSTKVYTLNVQIDLAALKSLKVNGTLIEGFDPFKRDYVVNLPTGVKTPPVVTPEFDAPLDPNLMIDQSNGSLPGTYTYKLKLDFQLDPKYITITFNSAPLQVMDIAVGGTSVDNFNLVDFEYNVTLPTGVYTLPAITPTFSTPDIQASDISSTVTGTFPGTVVYKMTVTKSESALTYTLNICSQDIQVNDLKVDGQTIANFAPEKINYVIDQPTGVTSLPTITPHFANADMSSNDYNIVQTGSLPGTCTYAINITKGTASKTITVTVNSPPITFDAIKINNTMIEGFDPNKTSYTIYQPTGQLTLPQLTATVSNSDMVPSDVTISSSGAFPGTVVYTITATKGSLTKVITVNVIGLPITLTNLLYNGLQITGFTPDGDSYAVDQGTGVTSEPVLSPIFANTDITASDYSISQTGQLPGTLMKQIAITKGSLSRTLTINVTSSPINFTDLKVNGTTIADFDTNKSEYTLSLPTGEAEPVIQPAFANPDITPDHITLTQTGSYPGTKTYKWQVVKGTQTRTITVTVNSAPITLSDLTINGTTILGFTPDKTQYNIEWSTGNLSAPELGVSFINSDLNSSNVAITKSGTLPGTLVYTVTITKGTLTKTITVHVTGKPIQVTSLALNGTPLSDFTEQQAVYTVQLGTGILTQPRIGLTFANPDVNDSHVTVTPQGSLPGTVTYDITIQKGDLSKHYLVTANSAPIQLKALSVNGASVPGVSAGQQVYNVTLAKGITAPPEVLASFVNADMTSADVQAIHTGSFPGTMVYTLTAHKGESDLFITVNLTSAGLDPVSPDKPDGTTDKDDSSAKPGEPATVTPTSAQTIANANSQLAAVPKGTSVDKTNTMVNSLAMINITLGAISDQTALLGAVSQLNNTHAEVLKGMQDANINDAAVLAQVTALTQTIEGKLNLIESPEDALTILKQYLDGLKAIKMAADIQTIDLDRSVEDMLEKTVERFGRTVIDAPKDSKTGIIIEAQDVAQPIQHQLTFIGELKTLNNAFFDDTDTRTLKTKIVIVVNAPDSEALIDVTFRPSALTSIKNNAIDSFALESEGSTITIPAAAVGRSSDLQVKMRLLPADDKIGQARVDFNVYENEQLREYFPHPIELKFDLSQFGLSEATPDSLGIYKLNEQTNRWEPVGGIVDPERGIIFVKRGSLSQYTVMKSKKSFSDADTSWAKAEINSMLNKGIIEDGKAFKPQSLITRAEFASWIAKAYGLKPSKKALPFKDMKNNKYYSEVAAVYELGLISGKTKSTFEPNGNITPDEMAVMIGKTLVLLDNKQSSTKVKSKYLSGLKNSNTSSWAENETALLMELGLNKTSKMATINGYVSKETAAATFMKFYRS